jgi:short-subunit dehydrogenase
MKKAIIVGASSGIGRQLAILLAGKNYIVAITGRRKYLLEELQSQWPDNFIISDFDITNTSIVATKLENLVAMLGGLDLLILSAGKGDINESLDFNIEKQSIDLNVIGFTTVVDWTINYFHQQQCGHLAAITSVAGIRGGRQAPAYNASKAFQINYLEGLRQKVTQLKLPIFITDLRPGFVATKPAPVKIKFLIAPVEKAARQMLQGIERKRSVVYVTRRWRLIAFLIRMLPKQIYNRI